MFHIRIAHHIRTRIRVTDHDHEECVRIRIHGLLLMGFMGAPEIEVSEYIYIYI